jgi:thioredoxin-like negative regulator of GroEL
MAAGQDKKINDLNRASELVKGAVVASEDPGEPIEPNGELKNAARLLVGQPLVEGPSIPVTDLVAKAKAFFLRREFQNAHELLERAKDREGNNPEVLFNLANTLLAQRQEAKAIPILERLVNLTGVNELAWKYLGYASLWEPSKLDQAESATQRYLELNPDDLGAKFNLACAYGQRGPQDEANRKRTFDLLREIIERDPRWRDKLNELTLDGQDFAAWRNDTEFQALLKTAAA